VLGGESIAVVRSSFSSIATVTAEPDRAAPGSPSQPGAGRGLTTKTYDPKGHTR
jgi:hypothetical protein